MNNTLLRTYQQGNSSLNDNSKSNPSDESATLVNNKNLVESSNQSSDPASTTKGRNRKRKAAQRTPSDSLTLLNASSKCR